MTDDHRDEPAGQEHAAGDASGQQPATGDTEAPAPPPDPMRSFRGVAAGTLVLEAITVALALPVISTLGDGVGSVAGVGVLVVVAALLVCCGLLRREWITPAILGLQVGLILLAFWSVPVGVLGALFLAVWLYLFRLRNVVAKRLADGTLPSQQTG